MIPDTKSVPTPPMEEASEEILALLSDSALDRLEVGGWDLDTLGEQLSSGEMALVEISGVCGLTANRLNRLDPVMKAAVLATIKHAVDTELGAI